MNRSCQLSVVRSQWQTGRVMTKNKLRVAVLGVGSLGKEHVRLYAELAAAGKVEFAGV